MNQKWIHSAVVGFLSGFCEPMPLSADAHRGLLNRLFGMDCSSPLFLLLCHVAVLVVMLMSGGLELNRLRRAHQLSRTPARRRSAQPDLLSLNTIKFLRSAGLIVAASRLLSFFLQPIALKLYILPAALVVAGILLWLPAIHRSGNKDARNMEKHDDLVMAIGAALSAIPGISLVGTCVSAGKMMGVSRRYALRFAWLLTVVSLCAGIGVDLLMFAGSGFEFAMSELIMALVGAFGAAVGAYLGIHLMHGLIRGAGIGAFCYYHWGLALLSMILFLIV